MLEEKQLAEKYEEKLKKASSKRKKINEISSIKY